jgi:Uma2 family endonuclease
VVLVLAQDDEVRLPREAIRFPVELKRPKTFDPNDPATWPDVDGRLEYVGGRLLYMPPCGDIQQDVAPVVTALLLAWTATHPEFIVGGNEAGMLLGGETRGADGAVWLRALVEPRTGGYRRVPPVLAVEVAGEDEDELDLRDKARWYLDHGVAVIWLVLPATREVVVISAAHEDRRSGDQRVPEHAALPDLTPEVKRFFVQL